MVADAGVTGLKTDRGPPTKHHSLFTDGKVAAIESFEFPWRAGPCCYLGFSQGKKTSLAGLFFFIFFPPGLGIGTRAQWYVRQMLSHGLTHPWVSPFLLRYGLKVALPAFGSISS